MCATRQPERSIVTRSRWLLRFVGICLITTITSSAAHGQYIFWIDNETNSILRADLDGNNRTTIVADLTEQRGYAGLAFDQVSDRLVWINNGVIFQATVDGEVVNTGTIDWKEFDSRRHAGGIALDLAGRLTAGDPKIYFASYGREEIFSVNPDGSDLSLLLQFNDDPEVRSLEIDFEHERFYWSVYYT